MLLIVREWSGGAHRKLGPASPGTSKGLEPSKRRATSGARPMQDDLFERRKEPTVTNHNLLESYLRPWARIIGSHFPVAWYVDAFAGRATYRTGEKGSAPIAADILMQEARSLLERSGKRCRFNVVCIERNRARAKDLRRYRDRLAEGIPFTVVEGDFENNIPSVLESVGETPAFFFLDPAGFSGMPMAAIGQILRLGHKEVLVNFMWNAIQRWSRAPSSQRAVTELMGTDQWGGFSTEREWLDLYIDQLKLQAKYVWAFQNKFPGKRRTLYYLVYGTNSLTGFKIMKDVMLRHDTRRYFEPDLFEQLEFCDFAKELQRRIRGARAVGRRKLLEFTLCQTQYLDKDLTRALNELELRGHVVKEGPRNSPVFRFVGGQTDCSDPSLVGETATVSYALSTATVKAPMLRRPAVVRRAYNLLDGESRNLVQRVGDGSIIKRFDRTPVPNEDRDVVCPHFLELKWAYGCPYDCAWCYLKGTLRFSPKRARPTVKDLKKVEKHTRVFLESTSEPEVLNTGEIADSLMYESSQHSFVSFILPLFETQEKHKILFLSKSDRIASLLTAPSHRQAIVSFSLNAHRVSDRWELKAPSVADRIRAAGQLSAQGYEVRVSVDPLVPIQGWREAYLSLVDQVFANFRPHRVTLGSLRGLQSTINNCPDKSWVRYLSDTSGWGRRVDHGLRCEMFAVLIEALHGQYNYHEIGLCKETLGVCGALGMDFRAIKCNCIR